jgi:diacylglycerol kinase family enzyme
MSSKLFSNLSEKAARAYVLRNDHGDGTANYGKIVVDLLRAAGLRVDSQSFEPGKGQGKKLALQAARSGKYELLVAFGGDGTINKAVQAAARTGKVALAPVTGGTVNRVSRLLYGNADSSRPWLNVLRMMQSAELKTDVGCVEPYSVHLVNGKEERVPKELRKKSYFLLSASAGAEATITKLTPPSLKYELDKRLPGGGMLVLAATALLHLKELAPFAYRLSDAGFDLRLMSWDDGSGVPTSGKKLVVVGTDNNGLLHIRIFDAAGNRIEDTDETQLPARAAAIATLKQRLPGLLPPHVLTGAEEEQVIAEATSIIGQTRDDGVGDVAIVSGGEARALTVGNAESVSAEGGQKIDDGVLEGTGIMSLLKIPEHHTDGPVNRAPCLYATVPAGTPMEVDGSLVNLDSRLSKLGQATTVTYRYTVKKIATLVPYCLDQVLLSQPIAAPATPTDPVPVTTDPDFLGNDGLAVTVRGTAWLPRGWWIIYGETQPVDDQSAQPIAVRVSSECQLACRAADAAATSIAALKSGQVIRIAGKSRSWGIKATKVLL